MAKTGMFTLDSQVTGLQGNETIEWPRAFSSPRRLIDQSSVISKISFQPSAVRA